MRPSFRADSATGTRSYTAGIGGELGARIWLSFSPELITGAATACSAARRGAWWDANKIGLSPPPWKPRGWLMLYQGVRTTPGGCLYRLGRPCWNWRTRRGYSAAATSGYSLRKRPASAKAT